MFLKSTLELHIIHICSGDVLQFYVVYIPRMMVFKVCPQLLPARYSKHWSVRLRMPVQHLKTTTRQKSEHQQKKNKLSGARCIEEYAESNIERMN